MALAPLPADPSDRVRYLFKRIALELDAAGELKTLAAEYAWSPSTVSMWIARGWAPHRVAEALAKRFGVQIGFKADDLSNPSAE